MALFGRPSEKDSARELAYRQWFERQHPFALASLLLSVFSLTHLGTLFIDSIAGVLLGGITLVQIARARDLPHPSKWKTEGRGLAIAGIAIGLLSVILGVVLYALPAVSTGAAPR